MELSIRFFLPVILYAAGLAWALIKGIQDDREWELLNKENKKDKDK